MTAEIEAYLGTGYATLQDICKAHHGPVYRLIFRYCGNRDLAADITQSTLGRVIEKIHLFRLPEGETRPKKALRNWVYKIARNIAINHYHQQKRNAHAEKMAAVQDVDEGRESSSASENFLSPEDALAEKEGLEWAVQSINDLSHRDIRETARLWFMEDNTYEEISEKLGVPIGTVMSRLHRAKKHLIEKTKKYYG